MIILIALLISLIHSLCIGDYQVGEGGGVVSLYSISLNKFPLTSSSQESYCSNDSTSNPSVVYLDDLGDTYESDGSSVPLRDLFMIYELRQKSNDDVGGNCTGDNFDQVVMTVSVNDVGSDGTPISPYLVNYPVPTECVDSDRDECPIFHNDDNDISFDGDFHLVFNLSTLGSLSDECYVYLDWAILYEGGEYGGDFTSISFCLAQQVYGEKDQSFPKMRNFRDHKLMKSAAGRSFINAYYRFSKFTFEYLQSHPFVRSVLKVAFYPIKLFFL